MRKYLLQIFTKYKFDLTYLLLFCIFPLVTVIIYINNNFLGIIFSIFIILFINLFILWLFRLNILSKIIAFIFKLTETIFAQLIIKTKGPFDISYVLDNLDTAPDIVFSHTTIEVASFFSLAIFLTFFAYFISKKIKFGLNSRIIILMILALVLVQATDGRYIFFDRLIFISSKMPDHPAVHYPLIDSSQEIIFDEEDNIVLLHLESWNSKVVNGDILIDEKLYQKPMAPVYLDYTERGLYFPEFYGNSMQTIRSQETTLCGITDNLGARYADRKGNFSFKCLPQIFSENGFKTYFFKADDIDFHGTKDFMKKIGFDVTVNAEIMKENDKEHYWGYQDDIFYQRIFEFLEKESPSKKFIYIAVSALLHYPYEMQEEFSFLKEFNNPKNTYEEYSNVLKQEDYCLKRFFSYYDKYFPENTHLFIFGDSSMPVGINDNESSHINAYDDNFLTTMLYIPPKKNNIEPQVIKKRYDQASLFHTILELFSENYKLDKSIPEITPNNISDSPRFIRLNQPYTDKWIALVQYPDKWIYNLKTKTIIYFNLKEDRFEQNPKIISTSADLNQFFEYVLANR